MEFLKLFRIGLIINLKELLLNCVDSPKSSLKLKETQIFKNSQITFDKNVYLSNLIVHLTA